MRLPVVPAELEVPESASESEIYAAQGSRRRASILRRKSVSLSLVFELVPVGDTSRINGLQLAALGCAQSSPNIEFVLGSLTPDGYVRFFHPNDQAARPRRLEALQGAPQTLGRCPRRR